MHATAIDDGDHDNCYNRTKPHLFTVTVVSMVQQWTIPQTM